MANPTKYASKLRSKRVLVLGATSGIGFCVAEASLEAGMTVIISGSNQPKIETTIQRLLTTYPDVAPRLSGHACDLLDTEHLEENLTGLLDLATAKGEQKLDHLVFTAGDKFNRGTLQGYTFEMIHKSGLVRFYAAFVLAKLLLPTYMHSSPAASVTFTGGVNSTKPAQGWGALAGFGSAIEGMTRGLAVDLAPVRVNCVAPGAVNTELLRSFDQQNLDQILGFYKSKTLTETVARPEDVAEAYLYVIRDDFVTGITLGTNGGYLLK